MRSSGPPTRQAGGRRSSARQEGSKPRRRSKNSAVCGDLQRGEALVSGVPRCLQANLRSSDRLEKAVRHALLK